MYVFAFYRIPASVENGMSLASQQRAIAAYLRRNPEYELIGESTDLEAVDIELQRTFLVSIFKLAERYVGAVLIADRSILDVVADLSFSQYIIVPEEPKSLDLPSSGISRSS